jgi:hypothetical protein
VIRNGGQNDRTTETGQWSRERQSRVAPEMNNLYFRNMLSAVCTLQTLEIIETPGKI